MDRTKPPPGWYGRPDGYWLEELPENAEEDRGVSLQFAWEIYDAHAAPARTELLGEIVEWLGSVQERTRNIAADPDCTDPIAFLDGYAKAETDIINAIQAKFGTPGGTEGKGE